MNYVLTVTSEQDELLARISALTLESLEEQLHKVEKATAPFMCPVDPQERNACESCQ